MIRDFPANDYETPIEEYPGFLALEWDESDLFTDIKELREFWKATWSAYSSTLVDEDLARDLVIQLAEGPRPVHIEASTKLAPVLDQLPAFDVFFDRGQPDAGPASGSGYVILMADSARMKEVQSAIAALNDAIRADYAAVRKQLDGK